MRSQLGERLESLPRVSGAEGEISLSNDLIKLLNLTDKLAQKRGDQYIASELFILAALDLKGALADILKQAGANREAVEKAIDEMRGGEQVVDPECRGKPPGAGEIHHRPDRAGRAKQAGPGDRARRGNPPLHPGFAAPHQEQPGADR